MFSLIRTDVDRRFSSHDEHKEATNLKSLQKIVIEYRLCI